MENNNETYRDLQDFLNTTTIPVSAPRIGFLELIGRQHHENINSALYAQFINSTEEIKSIFIEALLDWVYLRSGKKLRLIDVVASTETSTGNGRIDILIEDKRERNTIIIENKIYHHLNNDLLDYWNFVKLPDSQKVGVVLTLHPHDIPKELTSYFINITHIEWLSLVKERIRLIDIPPNYLIYITDFIQTIENLTNINHMNDATKFYFRNTDKVLQAKETINQAHAFINSQLLLIANEIGWQTYGNSIDWRNFWDEHNQLDTYLTIVTKDLLEGKMAYTLIIELIRKDQEKAEEIRELVKNHPQYGDKYSGDSTKHYIHFLMKEYTISEDSLADFSNHVVNNIRKDFADITLVIIKHLYKDRNLDSWLEKFTGISTKTN